MGLPSRVPADFDASLPLADPRYERFAQLRVIGVPFRTAANEAGFVSRGRKPILPGNAARLDRHPEVVARKAYLAADDAEVIAATRLFVRDRLMRSATLDVLSQFAILGSVEVDGKKISRVVGIDWEAFKASDQSIAVLSFKFDRETGMMTEFTIEDRLQALAQLRDMYGLRAPRKKEISGVDGAPIQLETSVSTTERAHALVQLMAKTATTEKPA